METGPKDSHQNGEQERPEGSNMRFYIICLCSFLFTIYLIVDQYMTNH